MIKLCIDPGHGSSNRKAGVYDPGACAGNLTEAGVVLEWALTGKWVCKEAGIECYLTRDDDSDPNPVGQRDDKAERENCTHFVSLHCNAGGGHGTETYYRDQRDKVLAQIANTCAHQSLGLPNRGVKSEGSSQHPRLAVFDFDGPACLVELGFIDNANDRLLLTKRECRLAFWRRFIGELKAL